MSLRCRTIAASVLSPAADPVRGGRFSVDAASLCGAMPQLTCSQLHIIPPELSRSKHLDQPVPRYHRGLPALTRQAHRGIRLSRRRCHPLLSALNPTKLGRPPVNFCLLSSGLLRSLVPADPAPHDGVSSNRQPARCIGSKHHSSFPPSVFTRDSSSIGYRRVSSSCHISFSMEGSSFQRKTSLVYRKLGNSVGDTKAV
jgi:hypothetical protein